MNRRFKEFVIPSRRKSSNQVLNGGTTSSSNLSASGPSGRSSPNSSQTSIPPPMNPQQNNPERPPSYPYSPPRGPALGPPQQPSHGPRPTSPLPPPVQTAGQVPPPATGYPPQTHQMYGQPPPYPPGNPPAPPNPRGTYYGPYRGGTGNQVAEVEGTGPSKAQLIVGIDFVGHPLRDLARDSSAIANLCIQRVLHSPGSHLPLRRTRRPRRTLSRNGRVLAIRPNRRFDHYTSIVHAQCSMLMFSDSHRTLLRSISERCWMGSRHC